MKKTNTQRIDKLEKGIENINRMLNELKEQQQPTHGATTAPPDKFKKGDAVMLTHPSVLVILDEVRDRLMKISAHSLRGEIYTFFYLLQRIPHLCKSLQL